MVFTMEIFLKYLSLDSSFKRSEKDVTNLPTIVICFLPTIKSYTYEADFTIFMFPSYQDFFKPNTEVYKLKMGNNVLQEVHLSQVLTIYSGICYKITSTASAVGKNDWHVISVIFNQDTPVKMLPNVVVHFTSEVNSYGILRTYWLDGDVSILKMTSRHKFVEYGLKEERQSFLEHKSRCRKEPFYHCYGSEILHHNFTKCPKKCLPHTLPSDIIPNDEVPFCETDSKEMKCSKEIALEVRTKSVDSGKCIDKACKPIKYKGVITHEEIVEEPLHSRSFAYYFMPPVYVLNFDEYIIVDIFELLGSIGGTWGILVGFSILGLTSFLLEKLQLMTQSFKNGYHQVRHNDKQIKHHDSIYSCATIYHIGCGLGVGMKELTVPQGR